MNSYITAMQDRIRKECESFTEESIFIGSSQLIIKNGRFGAIVEARDFHTRKKLEEIEVVNMIRGNKERITKKLEKYGLKK